MSNSNKTSLYVAAGLVGFIAGVLYAPDKGKVSRLKLKRGINKIADQALTSLESVEKQLESKTT